MSTSKRTVDGTIPVVTLINPQPTVWRYIDAAGVERDGIMVGSTDFGGHDISAHFRRVADGRLDIVRGKACAEIMKVTR